MPEVYMPGLDELEQLVQLEADGINFLRRSRHLDLQLAAMRRWPRYECVLEIYVERCAAAGRTPKIPVIEKPVVIRGGKHGVESQHNGKSG